MLRPSRSSLSKGGRLALTGLFALLLCVGCTLTVSLDGLAGYPAEPDAADTSLPDAQDGPPESALSDVQAEDHSAAPDAGCGPFTVPGTSSLSDMFGGTLLPNWGSNDACLQETGGAMVAQPLANATNSYCLGSTANVYHLTCDSVTVKVSAAAQTLGVQTFIYISATDTADQLLLFVEAGGFSLGPRDGPGAIPITTPYSPTSDLWWRLRETGGELFFESSPNGSTWALRGRGPSPMPFDKVRVTLGAGTYKAIASPGTARFQCFNAAPAACP